MKILILNNYYYPNMEGGAEYSIKILAENLAKNGHNVYIISMDGTPFSDIKTCENINGVLVYRSYSKSIFRRRLVKDKTHKIDSLINGIHSIYNKKMNDDLKYLIDMINPDIIHTQNLVSMSYWVWKYAKKKDIPVIHTLRDYWLLDPTTIPNTFPLIFDQLFQFKFRGLSNKYVDFVTAPSSRVLEIFNEEGYFKNSIKKTIVNCIDFNKETLFKSIKDRSTRTDTRIRYLYAGKVSDNKGIRILVEAFIESKIDGELIICGNGELTEWINSLNVQNIIQKGKLTQDELHKQYELADVLIVPSLWEEPFGRIIIEGAQYALVTIGSNKGGIPEIIKTLKCGDVYNSNSKEELIELLKKYANRDKLRKIYKEWPLNLDVFSIERQIASFENIYDRMKKGYL